MRVKKRLGFASVLLLILVISGCGSGPGPTPAPAPKPEFLYAMTLTPAQSPTFQLVSFKVDTTTGFLSLSGSTTLSGFVVPQFAVDPASKYLYMSFPGPGGSAIGIFAIDPNTGVPNQSSVFPVTQVCAFCPPISGPGLLSMDPAGKFLFYGSSTLGSGVFEGVGALRVNSATGTLSGVAGSPFPGDDAPLFLAVHPSGRFLYTENIDPTGAGGVALQSISGFVVDPNTGALTASVAGSPYSPQVNSTIGGLAIHPSGKYVYAVTGFGMNGIMGWSIDPAGALTAIPTSPFQPASSAFGTGTFDLTGKFFYTSGGGGAGILGFTVNPNGSLTPLPSSPFAFGTTLTSPVIDPTGKYLFAGDTMNKSVLTFSINPAAGTLTTAGAPAQATASPVFLTVVKAP